MIETRKRACGETKFAQGTWPNAIQTYRAPPDARPEQKKAQVDQTLTAGVAAYGSSMKKSHELLHTGLQINAQVNQETCQELCTFEQGLSPLSVAIHKQTALEVMDLIDCCQPRTISNIEAQRNNRDTRFQQRPI